MPSWTHQKLGCCFPCRMLLCQHVQLCCNQLVGPVLGTGLGGNGQFAAVTTHLAVLEDLYEWACQCGGEVLRACRAVLGLQEGQHCWLFADKVRLQGGGSAM